MLPQRLEIAKKKMTSCDDCVGRWIWTWIIEKEILEKDSGILVLICLGYPELIGEISQICLKKNQTVFPNSRLDKFKSPKLNCQGSRKLTANQSPISCVHNSLLTLLRDFNMELWNLEQNRLESRMTWKCFLYIKIHLGCML